MILEPECSKRRCRHLRYERDEASPVEIPLVCCDAFPSGVPPDIAAGKNLHLTIDRRQVGAVVFTRAAG